MRDANDIVFERLFKEACAKCFGYAITAPLSETDSRMLSNKILESTGLVIGPKSIRNYSLHVFNTREGRRENPSVATLDTLARYVLDAPYTDEVSRKNNESHYPYWFEYKRKSSNDVTVQPHRSEKRKWILMVSFALVAAVSVFFIIRPATNTNKDFTDHFNSVIDDSLEQSGWIVRSMDTIWWNQRNKKPGHLSLYTLRGDNWPSGENTGDIKNLLVHRISSDCFITEIHLTDFIPEQNWQQAGVLLAEDDNFSGKIIRLSISYNDFFGGYQRPPEILIQALSSSESGSRSKPEEIAHVPLFTVGVGYDSLVKKNLATSALKIEKKGNHFRFLYAIGEMEGFAFKEITSGDFTIRPKYVGLFAIQGFADNEIIPANFDSFSLLNIPCDP